MAARVTVRRQVTFAAAARSNDLLLLSKPGVYTYTRVFDCTRAWFRFYEGVYVCVMKRVNSISVFMRTSRSRGVVCYYIYIHMRLRNVDSSVG